MKRIRYSKILNLTNEFLEPSIGLIKRFKGRKTTSHKDLEQIIKIFFPKTKHISSGKGYYKYVYIIHSQKTPLVLKEGKRKDIRKDYNTYLSLPEEIRNRYFAKIYWRSDGGRFMLQKYGKRKEVPDYIHEKLKCIGKNYNLKDVRKENIMYFKNGYKIIDAERM